MSNEKLNQVGVGDKVYAVSSGSYSDYHIDRVFRTKGEAEGWISKRWNPREYEVEEWEFDTYNPSQLVGFLLHIDMETGSAAWGCETSCHEGPVEMDVEYRPASPLWNARPQFMMKVKCLAKDKAHAVKIASEYRRAVLASPLFETWQNSPDPSAFKMKWNTDYELPCGVVHP